MNHLPELDDLYNLYQYILINKRITYLSLVLLVNFTYLALNELSNKFSNEVKNKKK